MAMPPSFGNDPLGWSVVVAGAIATAFTVFISIYWTIRPGEMDPRHPKYLILRDDR
jgi:hypothetical protein